MADSSGLSLGAGPFPLEGMREQPFGQSELKGSQLGYGCWRLAGPESALDFGPEQRKRGVAAVRSAIDAGYTWFDLADIYGKGECERIFGAALQESPGIREKVVIATKCGIRVPGGPSSELDFPYQYDSSAQYIVRSCESSLERMGIDTIDLYQLHRPDFLMHPDEISQAFQTLRSQGKVREFGVSNFRPFQLEMLRARCAVPIRVHQVEVSLLQLQALEDGTLEQCITHAITPLAWSPLSRGDLGTDHSHAGKPIRTPRVARLFAKLDAMAACKGTDRSVIALSWLLKHPARIMPIIGSTTPDRIRQAVQAAELELTRSEWYELLAAARETPLP